MFPRFRKKQIPPGKHNRRNRKRSPIQKPRTLQTPSFRRHSNSASNIIRKTTPRRPNNSQTFECKDNWNR